jgi:DNA-binding transcriptional regulator YiaG
MERKSGQSAQIADVDELPVPSPRQLRAIRGWFGWSQREAAAVLGIYLSTLQDFEKAARRPQRPIQLAIAAAIFNKGVKFFGEELILPP